ncbi:MAG: undecaprenyldiphospho-muramoylpentapeptide beta-N-acetylglucosaminyltransferase [Patescibacteria group bacterium]
MRIILTGGGTIGSVSPLLAVREKIIEQKIEAEFIWIGTEHGLEREILAQEDISFFAIKSGKWRRYFSAQNFFDIFRFIVGFFQAIKIIRTFKPDLILSAGSFVSVPVVLAGALFHVRIIVHQQDLKIGLANRLSATFATRITVAFDESLKYFPAAKTVLTGNPVRSRVATGDKESAVKYFGLEIGLPTLLVMGGSLGAEAVNKLLFAGITRLIEFCQIIHIVGRGNLVDWTDRDKFGVLATRYHSYEYMFEKLNMAYAAADLVVCRAGLSTLTELSFIGKPTILIPIPNNQQGENARYFDSKNAVVVMDESEENQGKFVDTIKNLLSDAGSLRRLSDNMKRAMEQNANDKYLTLIMEQAL